MNYIDKLKKVSIEARDTENKGIWANPWFKYFFIVIITGIIVGLILMGINQMFGKDKTPKETYNVISNNQTGGITAGKFEGNIYLNQKSSRHLTDQDRNDIDKMLISYSKEFMIINHELNPETLEFVNEIKEYFESKNITVNLKGAETFLDGTSYKQRIFFSADGTIKANIKNQ